MKQSDADRATKEPYEALVAHLARGLCANTNVATRDSPVPIYDVPDDLVWLDSPDGPVLAARWRLYEERARIAYNRRRLVFGSPATVKARLLELQQQFDADELMIITITGDYETRLESYTRIAEICELGQPNQKQAR